MSAQLAHAYAQATYDYWALNEDEDCEFRRPLWSQCSVAYMQTYSAFAVVHRDFSPVYVSLDGGTLVDLAAFNRERTIQ